MNATVAQTKCCSTSRTAATTFSRKPVTVIWLGVNGTERKRAIMPCATLRPPLVYPDLESLE